MNKGDGCGAVVRTHAAMFTNVKVVDLNPANLLSFLAYLPKRSALYQFFLVGNSLLLMRNGKSFFHKWQFVLIKCSYEAFIQLECTGAKKRKIYFEALMKKVTCCEDSWKSLQILETGCGQWKFCHGQKLRILGQFRNIHF